MVITPFTGSLGSKPLTQITPFTYRDGLTFLQILNEFEKWLHRVNIEIDDIFKGNLEEFNRLYAEVKSDLSNTKQQWENKFDQFMLNVIDELKGLNDKAVAGLVEDSLSSLRVALDKTYANKATEITVTEGRLSAQRQERELIAHNKRSFTANKATSATLPEHFITTLKGGALTGNSVFRVDAYDSSSLTPSLESMGSMYERTHASVIVNGSGWKGDGTRRGLSIRNGVLLHAWEPYPGNGLGIEALVIMKDGSFKIYDYRTPPEQIIAEGGWNSFCHAKALYKDGKATGIENEPGYDARTGRQAIGDTTDGDVVIVTFPGKTGSNGATALDVKNAVAGLKMNTLYLVDGGGSTQLMVDGDYVVKSTDAAGERSILDALYFYAPNASKDSADSGWKVVDLNTDLFSPLGPVPQIRKVKAGSLELVELRMSRMTYVGPLLTVPTHGDIPQQLVGQVPEGYEPNYMPASLHSGQRGRVATGMVADDRNIFLAAVAGSRDINNGEEFSLVGMWLRG